jgi:uncharacterized protein YndB with AHSA1/START domain
MISGGSIATAEAGGRTLGAGEIMSGGVELRQEIYTEPATVFALLMDATRMMSWLAEVVEADPRPGDIYTDCWWPF